ncbi:MAG: RNA polymerase sigma factor [Pseudomonadales bacterium]|nr:RNA polymerase sigma factor [Pseudomonadales bacterium]
MRARIDEIYASDSRRVLATLIRLLGGDFDLAEETMHEAFAIALTQWESEGVPDNPRAWLVSTARFKAIDQIRRRVRFDEKTDEIVRMLEANLPDDDEDDPEIADDRLRLIFTCSHPGLAPESRLALTLREVCGLTTEEIARALLARTPAVAQRIVRAKAKIRDAGIPYEVPGPAEQPARLDSVLQVIYVIFNEGYAASSGNEIVRADLSAEAIRLGRLLVELLPEPEVQGLLGLMLLTDARREARVDDRGDLVLLEDQDRTKWQRESIDEGSALVTRALESGRFGPYTLQAAIAAVHCEAARFEDTDWAQIVGLYDALLADSPSAVIALNRAVAVAMVSGPAAGLEIVDGLLAQGQLEDYHLAHATRADFCRRLGRTDAARAAYEEALRLATLEPERRFLARRLAELSPGK